MRRRDALAGFAGLATTGLAGCLGGVRSTLGLGGSDPPEPVAPTKPLGQYDCPTFQNLGFDGVDHTICYREKNGGPDAVRFAVSKRTAHLPPDLVEFTMKRVGSGPAYYVLREGLVARLTDHGWKLVAPTSGSDYGDGHAVALRADESYTWTVGIGGDAPDKTAGDGLLRLGSVSPGVYAFRARGRLDNGGVEDTYDIDTANATLFTVRGPKSDSDSGSGFGSS